MVGEAQKREHGKLFGNQYDLERESPSISMY